ncbi:hypothetical protein MPER_10420 [Moniliophthora perniciosa FA553]|nr:hypothetical protein MPER_10420 [Moniliophthora perniciosa FA553]
MDTKDFFRSEGLSGKMFGGNSIFTGFDGKEYKWNKAISLSSKLVLKDESTDSEIPVAKFHYTETGYAKSGDLEIYPAGEHMAELIIVTFIIDMGDDGLEP